MDRGAAGAVATNTLSRLLSELALMETSEETTQETPPDNHATAPVSAPSPIQVPTTASLTPAPTTAAARTGFENYRPAPGILDEFMTEDRKVRPHFQTFLDQFTELDAADLRRRSETANRIIHEQGITYNVHGDPRGMERPWQLDCLPLLISAAEWQSLEAGLIQRATLLNRIVADCYGAQELIHSAQLPPGLLFSQPEFLRPCHGIRNPDGTYIHLYAADVARSPDGQWRVIADRTQIPTGAGYALANRLVTSRVLPEAFRACQVHRLAPFFRDFQQTLARLSPRATDNPRIVLLTPGPYNETYFEQAWLARYLGYVLVEGQDLTVRDDRVFLKTLSGLEPVDVILRRVDDDWCDPLELRNESTLGIPGLLEALRAGNVSIANALGTGIVQTPALMPLLPSLCRHLLGQELLIDSIPTWWCGQPAEHRYVLDHLDSLTLRPTFGSGKAFEPCDTLSDAEKEDLRRLISFRPHAYVGQEPLSLSTAPALDHHGMGPKPVAVRIFLVATKDSYRAMPGGLARVAPEPGSGFIAMQRGGTSKDTWVLADGPVEELSLLHTSSQSVELRRVGNNLPSRLADNYFWLGRYCERADATARLLRSTLVRFNPENTGSATPLLEPLLAALAAHGQLPSAAERPDLSVHPELLEAELLAAIFEPDRKGSLRRLADHLQHLAMLVRDRTANDLWRVLSTIDDRLTIPAGSPVMLAGDAVGVLNQTILGLASFHGLARENMTRAQGWRFLDMGVRLERAIYLATFLDGTLRSPEADNPSVLEAVLEVVDNSITYRSRYNLLPNIAAVYDLVMLDDTNPRSLLFQLQQLVKHFERLPREKENALPSPAFRILLDCLTRVRLTDPRSLTRLTGQWHAGELGEVLQHVLREIPRLSDAIAVSYFAHSTTSRAGSGFGPEIRGS